MKKIGSTRNPLVREVLGIKVKRQKHGHSAFIAEGPNLVGAALEASGRCLLRQVFVSSGFLRKGGRLMKRLMSAGAEIYEVNEQIIEKLSGTETPQGIIAVASYQQPGPDELTPGGILAVADGIQDPGNIGSIIRTADAAGAMGVVILPGTCDPFSEKALRASAGSVFNIPLIFRKRRDLTSDLKSAGVPLAVTRPDAETSVFDAGLCPPIALAFGNETGGISDELESAAALRVRVPIPGRADSLNVASAAAICIYEALRGEGKST
jgi:TrmH family RNA methyltransferase